MWSRTFTALLTAGLVVGALPVTGVGRAGAAPLDSPTATAPTGAPKGSPAGALGPHDVDLLTAAQRRGDRRVTLIIATDRGEAPEVAAAIGKLGGTIARRFDPVGYLLVQVPTGKVLTAAKLSGVAAVDLDERIPLTDPAPGTSASPGATTTSSAAAPEVPVPGVAAPGVATPAVNPYLPTNDIGSVDFKQQHRAWDGRGVTVGVMDSGVDLDHPALRTTSTGQRKIADWVTATDPLLDGDDTWRPMVTEVTGPSFSYAGQTFKAPPGTWRVNQFLEAITSADDAAGDVNRDGDTTDAFGILYDPKTHDIRVDSNQNRDFTDDAVMRPYAERFDVGHFGTDDPSTPVVERMPFVVEFRQDVDLTPAGYTGQHADFVNIGIPESPHGTHVAGIIAGNDLLGGTGLDGQAPGARIVSSRACSWGGGCTASALTTGMVDLVVNRHVDVVNMSIGGLPALNDGDNARARLYTTLIDEYGVQLIISGGNSGPGLNTIGDPSLADDVISVAAGISRDTWRADYGASVTKPYAVFNFSSRGPREDGGFKPDLVAPGAAISTINTWLAGEPVPEAGYPLPPGYAMFNGTSMAAPQATGGAALLLSAARATDRAVTPAALRRALYTSAVPIPGVGVEAQGNGLMNVPGAWKLLTKDVATRRYTAVAPVCTPLSDFLATPGRGTGIYNRCAVGAGGQRAGQPKLYTVRVTRRSGPDRPIEHQLSWLGGDGAFRTLPTVALPLNVTVSVPVQVTPVAGANSAILRIDDPDTSTVDFEVLNTVVAATVPSKPAYAIDVQDAVERSSSHSYFVTVPAGASALQVNLAGIATGSQTRFIAIDPWGVPVEDTSSLVCYTNRPLADCKPQQRVYAEPTPGVWELEVEARRTTASLVNPFALTARVLGVDVSPPVAQVAEVAAGQPTAVTWQVQNRFGPVQISGQGGPLGSAVLRQPTIAAHEDKTYRVEVPAGARRLEVAIGGVTDRAADLDLTVSLGGKLVGQSADGDSEEAVSVDEPQAGTYTVVVSGYAVPSGSTRFDYLDVYFSRGLGRLSVSDRSIALPSGATAKLTGRIVAAAGPPADRTLFGELSVVTDSDAVVGQAAVTIGKVTNAPRLARMLRSLPG